MRSKFLVLLRIPIYTDDLPSEDWIKCHEPLCPYVTILVMGKKSNVLFHLLLMDLFLAQARYEFLGSQIRLKAVAGILSENDAAYVDRVLVSEAPK